MRYVNSDIIGKYKLEKEGCRPYITDNPREVIFLANKYKDLTPVNICGERTIYNDGKRWRLL